MIGALEHPENHRSTQAVHASQNGLKRISKMQTTPHPREVAQPFFFAQYVPQTQGPNVQVSQPLFGYEKSRVSGRKPHPFGFPLTPVVPPPIPRPRFVTAYAGCGGGIGAPERSTWTSLPSTNLSNLRGWRGDGWRGVARLGGGGVVSGRCGEQPTKNWKCRCFFVGWPFHRYSMLHAECSGLQW